MGLSVAVRSGLVLSNTVPLAPKRLRDPSLHFHRLRPRHGVLSASEVQAETARAMLPHDVTPHSIDITAAVLFVSDVNVLRRAPHVETRQRHIAKLVVEEGIVER